MGAFILASLVDMRCLEFSTLLDYIFQNNVPRYNYRISTNRFIKSLRCTHVFWTYVDVLMNPIEDILIFKIPNNASSHDLLG